jgi:RNA polymerase sigma-70 factor (ECF subfamily)
MSPAPLRARTVRPLDVDVAVSAPTLVSTRSASGTPGADAVPPEDEALLVERVRGGEPAAFDVLVRRYLRRAYAVAYRILGHREDAEDLVQEAFMTALDHIDTFRIGEPFGPWFFRILINRGLNARKARAVRQMAPVPQAAADTRSSPLADVERAEVRERFRAALEVMPARQRLVVQLIDVEGMKASDVAAMLEIPPGTVRWYLHEARAALRAALASLHGDDA